MLRTQVQNANAISHKVKKEGKPHGKNPPPKREMKRMHGWSNQDPTHYNIHPIDTIENDERKRDRIGSPPKRRMSNRNCSDEEADPRM